MQTKNMMLYGAFGLMSLESAFLVCHDIHDAAREASSLTMNRQTQLHELHRLEIASELIVHTAIGAAAIICLARMGSPEADEQARS